MIEKFTPTIKRAIQATLLDMATRSIKEQSEPTPAPAPTPTPVLKAPGADAERERSGDAGADKPGEKPSKIVTTPDELEALDLIRSICADSPLAASAPVLHRDTANWFTISTISIRRWFVRLYFNQRRRSILTSVAPEQTRALCPGFEVDGSRVYINANKDLLRLRPLILLAYEEAARQSEPASADDGA